MFGIEKYYHCYYFTGAMSVQILLFEKGLKTEQLDYERNREREEERKREREKERGREREREREEGGRKWKGIDII